MYEKQENLSSSRASSSSSFDLENALDKLIEADIGPEYFSPLKRLKLNLDMDAPAFPDGDEAMSMIMI